MDLDDWELSVEEMDSLERDAMKRVAERNSSSSVGTCGYTHNISSDLLPNAYHVSPHASSAFEARSTQTTAAASIVIPSSMEPRMTEDHPKHLQPKLFVSFFLHSSGSIAAKFPYNPLLVEAFRKVPRSSWNAKERIWMFPMSSLSSAEDALSNISGSNVELENLDPLVRRAIVAASAVPDLQDRYRFIPESIESKLLPFQRDGVRFMLQHGIRALLADDMGLGKTLQAIAVTSCIREAWPVLVLTPSSLRLHWASTIHEWLNIPPSDILVLLSQSARSNRAGFNILASNAKRSIQLDGVFNIISYDIVPKFQDLLMTSGFKVVIVDESHFLKNAQAKRTAASIPILQRAQYVILLSGTPALSRPIELFKQLEALYPDVYRSVHDYGNRYCKGGLFGLYQGASNHEELHNLMKATVMIRRLKRDVLTELPMKRRQQVFLDLGEKEMTPINALFRELEVIKGKIKSCHSNEEADSLKFTQKNLINKIYTESAEAKIPAVLDYLGTISEAGPKFLIFAHHQPMINSIHQFLLKKKVGCIRIDGGTPAGSRQELVKDFEENESIKAAVLSIKAGGFGLTLTAASMVIFAELSWTPGDLIQAEDRVHRIGQVSSVNVYYLLANDTVDDIIWDVVHSKLDNLGQMLDGEESSSLNASVNMQHRSPAKRKNLDSLNTKQHCSPAKQKTLDSFIKRCSSTSEEVEPNLKFPRH